MGNAPLGLLSKPMISVKIEVLIQDKLTASTVGGKIDNGDDIPTVKHAELARACVNVAIGTANFLRIGTIALGRAVGDGAFLWDAVADGDLENVTAIQYKQMHPNDLVV